jgi:hypothetical protein
VGSSSPASPPWAKAPLPRSWTQPRLGEEIACLTQGTTRRLDLPPRSCPQRDSSSKLRLRLYGSRAIRHRRKSPTIRIIHSSSVYAIGGINSDHRNNRRMMEILISN